jgi:hypothetical protein
MRAAKQSRRIRHATHAQQPPDCRTTGCNDASIAECLINFRHFNRLETHAQANVCQRRYVTTAAAPKSKVCPLGNRIKGNSRTQVLNEPLGRFSQNATSRIQYMDRIAPARQQEGFSAGRTGESGGGGIRAKDGDRKRVESHCHHPSLQPRRLTGRSHNCLVAEVYPVEITDGSNDHWRTDPEG